MCVVIMYAPTHYNKHYKNNAFVTTTRDNLTVYAMRVCLPLFCYVLRIGIGVRSVLSHLRVVSSTCIIIRCNSPEIRT